MPNPRLPADMKALTQSSLEAGISPVAVARLTNVLYQTVCKYNRNIRDFKELIPPKLAKLGPAKAMPVRTDDASRQI